MADQDYQLEEFENNAVNKSNMAKRAAAAAGLVGGGALAGHAINHIGGGEDTPQETLSQEDLEGVAEAGANQVEAPQAEESHHTHHPHPQPTPVPPAEETVVQEDPELTFDKTTQYYSGDQLIITEEEGTLDGRNFKLVDLDGDLRADILAYDEDGNGIYNEDEIIELQGRDKIVMGHDTKQTETVRVYEVEREPFIFEDEKGYAYEENIHNDFEDEKTGEVYSHDYAENNENYNNNGDVENYTAEYKEENLAYVEPQEEEILIDGEPDDSYEPETFEEDNMDLYADNADDSSMDDSSVNDFDII